MRHFIFATVAIVLGMCGPISAAVAQLRLTEFSTQQALRWRIANAAAESIATMNKIPLRVERADGRIDELQRFEHGIPRIYKTMNLTSAKTMSSDKVWLSGGNGLSLSGLGITLGEWDGGAPLTTHQEFSGRILSSQGAVIGHATHVAGTMIAVGVQPNARGMSNHANISAYDWNNDAAEMAAAASGGLHVSNHSYGLITGWDYNYFNDGVWCWFGDTTVSGTQDYRFGFYDDEAQTWDNVAYNAPYYLIDKAAGNDRAEGPTSQPIVHWVFNSLGQRVASNTFRPRDGGSSGYGILNGAATSKNVLVVGAVNGIPAGYQQPSDVVMSSFSCWGPTDDGRIKPDVVADGVGLYSSYSISNTSYANLSGTSMATPSATGSVGLLLEHQMNLHGSTLLRASTLRGLIIHTADDAGNPGPDYSFGWGLMNTLHAAQLMSLDSSDGSQSHLSERQLNQGDTLNVSIYSNGDQPLKVTICWTDPPGTSPSPSVNPPDIMLVNDLDLRVIKQSDQSVNLPWALNPSTPTVAATHGENTLDNVEQVTVPISTLDVYTVRITHKNTLFGGSQIVSLIVSGNVPYHKPIISLAPSTVNDTLSPGAMSLDSLKVVNRGNVTLNFSCSADQPWVQPDTTPHSIPPFDSAFVHFTIDAATLSQWSVYHDSITITSDDTANAVEKIPVTLLTLGPKIFSSASPLMVETDSGLVAPAAFHIRNIGTIPLTFTVAENDTIPRPWLSITDSSGIVAPGESTAVHLSIDATTLSPGSYNATLKIASNDSSTGDLGVALQLTVFNGTELHVSIGNAWNMVSVPMTLTDNLKSHIYPAATSAAFAYSGNYVVRDSLKPGIGYWLKFSSSQSITMNGLRIVMDTIAVNAGWNLIGSISFPVPVATIRSNSPGITTSNFFAYTGQYAIRDTIEPGKAYWVKVNQNGRLVLSSLSLSDPANRITITPTSEHPPAPPSESTPVVAIPTEFSLKEAYPNPFNPTTTLRYELPAAALVNLTVYNLLGQAVHVLVDRIEEAGDKSVVWNADHVVSGVYFCRMEASPIDDPGKPFVQMRKIVLLK